MKRTSDLGRGDAEHLFTFHLSPFTFHEFPPRGGVKRNRLSREFGFLNTSWLLPDILNDLLGEYLECLPVLRVRKSGGSLLQGQRELLVNDVVQVLDPVGDSSFFVGQERFDLFGGVVS
jgi:hypothetical protein